MTTDPCPRTVFPDGTACGDYDWHAKDCPAYTGAGPSAEVLRELERDTRKAMHLRGREGRPLDRECITCLQAEVDSLAGERDAAIKARRQVLGLFNLFTFGRGRQRFTAASANVDCTAEIQQVLGSPMPDPIHMPDPSHGQIDSDIQATVDEMHTDSLGQRVAIERTMQDLRDNGLA